MRLFIDFDGVLYNSNKFRADLIAQVEKSGFSREEVLDTYNAECLDGNYLPADHLNRLEKIHKFNLRLAEARIENLVNSAKKYLFPDVENSLKIISKLPNYQAEMISLGHPKFQPRKIKKAKIGRYFRKLHFTAVPKVEYLENLVKKNEKFIVVDDRGDALEEIVKKFPKAIAIEMRRERGIHDPAERPSHFSGPKITNLKQLIEIL